MVIKRRSELKMRECAHRSIQYIYIDKNEYSSLILKFYIFKYIYRVIAKEDRDMVTIDLPGFFL